MSSFLDIGATGAVVLSVLGSIGYLIGEFVGRWLEFRKSPHEAGADGASSPTDDGVIFVGCESEDDRNEYVSDLIVELRRTSAALTEAVKKFDERESWWGKHGGVTVAALIAVIGSVGLGVMNRPSDDCLAFITELRELRVAFPNSDPEVLFGVGGWEPNSAADGCGDPSAIWAALEP